ncbi:adenylate kinase [Luteolibacter sp. SL250]|uniref:adenylate kinase n=1 Tax=Luteolibacter sp. SL250 TaxID=2995170 RepID=UPI00226D42C1|nr:adenylate kinase [Luteolibacter sp. SL250]WAC17800.1 adenylate kinase [Luteolibacter sp. SL250]
MKNGPLPPFTRPARINVVGVSGSGKSTLAKRLSTVTGIRHIEMDALFWKPGWTGTAENEFLAKVEHALAGEEWILDGNYSRTQPVKWRRATMVVWVDFSFPRTLWQAARRAFGRSFTKAELWPGTGNRESFRKSFFSKDSIIWWTITSYGRQRGRYLRLMEDPEHAHLTIIRFRSPREVSRFLMRFEEQEGRRIFG